MTFAAKVSQRSKRLDGKSALKKVLEELNRSLDEVDVKPPWAKQFCPDVAPFLTPP